MNVPIHLPANMRTAIVRSLILASSIGWFAPSAHAQSRTNEWSRIWSSDVHEDGENARRMAVNWVRPRGYAFRTEALRASITLQSDPHEAMVLLPMDVRTRLRVKAHLLDADGGNPRDTLFILDLSVGHRWNRDTVPGLDRRLDLRQHHTRLFTGTTGYEVEVEEIRVNNGHGYVEVEELPANMYLDLRLQHQHRSLEEPLEAPVVSSLLDDCAITNENNPYEGSSVILSWTPIDGATGYDVEWTFVDRIPTSGALWPWGEELEPEQVWVDLRRDATRVSTSTTSLAVPMIAERGFMAYRVRGVFQDEEAEILQTGAWSSPDAGWVDEMDHVEVAGTSIGYNWQLKTAFAEEGKRKDVITYADGTLRPRQIQTRSSTNGFRIIEEIVYDGVGRPAIRTLPIPEVANTAVCSWGFRPNWMVAAGDYGYDSYFIAAAEPCTQTADPLSSVSEFDNSGEWGGAAYYYSSAIDPLFGTDPDWHTRYPLIPKDNGYPFSHTQYTRDNTGRVRRQGGVGEQFQLGSGHETEYLYGTPDQLELDRLFGSEAGYAEHYQKVTTIDPNDQASVSYLDRFGRTVATALTGKVPGGDEAPRVEPLESYTTLPEETWTNELLCYPLPSPDCSMNVYDPTDQSLRFTDQFTVPVDRIYTITYNVLPPAVHFTCPEALCYNCVYNFSLTLQDECGTVIRNVEDILGRFNTSVEPNGAVYLDCETPETDAIDDQEEIELAAGSYTLTKVLRVHAGARSQYLADYLEQAETDCQGSSQSMFTSEQTAQMSESDCDIDCNSCREALGTLDQFLLDGRGDRAAYEMLEEQCDLLCEDPSWCDIAYRNMLTDVTPGGQYARFVRTDQNTINAPDPLSILREWGWAPIYNRVYHSWSMTPDWGYLSTAIGLWRQPKLVLPDGERVKEYREEDGERTKIYVTVDDNGNVDPPLWTGFAPEYDENGAYTYPERLFNLADFIDAWRPGWERSLVIYHPEYGYYLQCKGFKDVIADDAMSSEAFDADLRNMTFGEAGAIVTDPVAALMGSDPFLVHADLFGPEADALAAKLAVYSTSTASGDLTMAEAAMALVRCGVAPFTSACTTGTLNATEWAAFRSMYLAEKYMQQKLRMDRMLSSLSCADPVYGGVNHCIGIQDRPRYWNWPGSYWYLPCQTCSPMASSWLFAQKAQRMQDPRNVPMWGTDPAQAAAQVYMQTGLCPAALSWKALFQHLIVNDQLDEAPYELTENAEYLGVLAAVNNMTAIAPSGVVEWAATENTSPEPPGLTATLQTATGDDCTVTLTAPFEGFVWDDILGVVNFLPGEGGAFTLRVLYLNVGDDEHPTTEWDITGTMCEDFLLAPCNFPPTCTPNAIAYGLSDLMGGLLEHGGFTSTTQVDLSSASFPTTPSLTLQEIVAPEIVELLSASSTDDLGWTYDGADTWTLDNITTATAPHLELRLSVVDPEFPYAWPTNAPDVEGLSNFSPEYENFLSFWMLNSTGDLLGIAHGSLWLVSSEGESPIAVGTCELPPRADCAQANPEILDGFFRVIRERLITNAADLDASIDLFASPEMNTRIRAVLAPAHCDLADEEGELLDPMLCETTSSTEVDPEETFLTISFGETTCPRITLPNVPFTDIVNPRHAGSQDEHGFYHAFVADLMDGEEVVGTMQVEHDCVDIFICPDCCDQSLFDQLADAMEWVMLELPESFDPAEVDVFDYPDMSTELRSLLAPLLDPYNTSGTGYTSHVVFSAIGDQYVFGFQEGDCPRLYCSKYMPGAGEYMTFTGAWESVDLPDEQGYHHVFRVPVEVVGETMTVSQYMILEAPCLDLQTCHLRNVAGQCDRPGDQALINELARVVVERLAANRAADPIGWLTDPVDLFQSPLLGSELRHRLGEALCPDCPPDTYASTSVFTDNVLHIGDCIHVASSSVTWPNPYSWPGVDVHSVPTPTTSEEIDPHAVALYAWDAAPYGLWLTITWDCLDLESCELYSALPISTVLSEELNAGSRTRTRDACLPAYTTTCAEAPTDCSERLSDLLTLVDEFNVFAEAFTETETSIDPAWFEENECYFIDQYLCPCLDGYMAHLRAAMADEELSEDELSDPKLWCLFSFCTLPEACSPAPSLEIPEVGVDVGNDCIEAQATVAAMNGELLYQQQQWNYTQDFLAAYNSQCSQALERLATTYTGRGEHHFTLYYYDQAGNLVRTVPPEGVEEVDITSSTSTDALVISNDRVSGTRSTFTEHRMASDHVYNSLDQPIRASMPDQDPMDLWESKLPTGLPDNLRITSSHILEGGTGYLTGNVPVSLSGVGTHQRGMFFKTTDGGNTWEQKNNLAGGDLKAVTFYSSGGTELAYAVGNNGTVLRSSDGGTTWDHLSYSKVQPYTHLEDVGVWNNSGTLYGAAVSSSNRIQRMTGMQYFQATPTDVSAPSPQYPSAFTSVAAIVPTSGSPVPWSAALTHDGKNGLIYAIGASANAWSSPVQKMATMVNFTCAATYSVGGSQRAYLAGDLGVLLFSTEPHSTTGSWKTIKTGTTDDFVDIWFMDDDNGLAILKVPGGDRELRYTMDGGESWVVLSSAGENVQDIEWYDTSSDVAAVVAVGDGGLVLRVLMDGANVPVLDHRPGIAPTVDLTACWAMKDVNGHVVCLAGDENGDLHFAADIMPSAITWSAFTAVGQPIRTIRGYPYSITELHVALLTDNGSNAGNKQTGTIDLTNSTWTGGTASTTNYYRAMDMASNGKAYFFNSNDIRLEYHDLTSSVPGTSTNVSASSLSASSTTGPNQVRTIRFTDTDHLVAGGVPYANASLIQSGGLMFTATLSSGSWADINRNVLPLPILDLFASTGNTSLKGVGAQGNLFHRVDINGTSTTTLDWFAIPTRIVQDLNAGVYYGGTSNVVVVGKEGVLCSGPWSSPSSWTIHTLAVYPDLNDVVVRDAGSSIYEVTVAGDDGYLFYNPNLTSSGFVTLSSNGGAFHGLALRPGTDQVIAVGDKGVIVRLVGTTRQVMTDIYSMGLNDTHFSTPTDGYVVGEHMLMRRTSDAGATWQVIRHDDNMDLSHDLNAVFSIAPDSAIAVGTSCEKRSVPASTLAPLTSAGLSGSCAGTPTWKDVVVTQSRATLIVGGTSTEARYVFKPAGTGNWNSNPPTGTPIAAPLTTVWQWPVHDGFEQFMIGDNSGKLRLLNRDVTLSTMTFSSTANVIPLASTAISSIWFHDRVFGLVATDLGALYRVETSGIDFMNVTTWDNDDLSTPELVQGDWDGQSTPSLTGIKTIQFLDRDHGFIGGDYDRTNGSATTPYRFARVVKDATGLYSQRFWYDRLGRLVLSQNTKQFNYSPQRYSYSRYDALGRVTEAGELIDDEDLFLTIFGTDVEGEFQSHTIDDDELADFIAGGDRHEVTRTYYDAPLVDDLAHDDEIAANFRLGFQRHLRNRVAMSSYTEDPNEADDDPFAYQQATHYSYDIHGNVEELVQEYPELGDIYPISQPQLAYKTIRYKYDLISGNVKEVHYEDGEPDGFHHKYLYDADNRITSAYTMREGDADYHEDAAYFYYPHGPLARLELGAEKVQGLDYTYTLQGWLKGINSNTLLPANDPGHDADLGMPSHPHAAGGRDAFGLTLHYYSEDQQGAPVPDYEPIAAGPAFVAENLPVLARSLYNGNISALARTLQPDAGWGDVITTTTTDFAPTDESPRALGNRYVYDQLNRLYQNKTVQGLTETNDWSIGTNGNYLSNYRYDANGNILTAGRRDQNGNLYDSLTYQYQVDAAGHRVRNRLYRLKDQEDASDLYANDVQDLPYQPKDIADPTDGDAVNQHNNYGYDVLGNLVRDSLGGQIDAIEWTVAGKVKSVSRYGGSLPELTFGYGAQGHRYKKEVSTTGSGLQYADYYVHDATGNVMAIYRYQPGDLEDPMSLKVTERPIYGSDRVGADMQPQELLGAEGPDDPDNGNLRYELKDHLGNVLGVVSDNLLSVDYDNNSESDYHQAEIISLHDYEPFGSLLPGRNYSSDSYRFGFQAQEKDDEIKGSTGTSYAFEYRMHDPRLGKFLSIDPLGGKYPWNSPYAFSENRVIDAMELEGLESAVIHQKYNPENHTMTLIDVVEWQDVEPGGSREHGPMGEGTLYFTEYPATEFGPAHMRATYSRSWGEAFSDLFSELGGVWGFGSEGMRDKGRDGMAWDPEAFMLVVDKLKKGFPDKFQFDKYKPGRQNETSDELSDKGGLFEEYVHTAEGEASGESEPGAAASETDTITITIHEEGFVKDSGGFYRGWSGTRQIRTTPRDTIGKNYKVIKN